MSPIERTRCSLEGLSLGDAFGERFFVPEARIISRIVERRPPSAPWYYTDDTEMALSIVDVLKKYGRIDQPALAGLFGKRFNLNRGYGGAMHELLPRLADGEDWRIAAPDLFNGQGSYGNGAAMRVAPVGAYFADDLGKVVEQAALSAEVTHAHLEGIAGAIAVAVAAALAWRAREEPPAYPGEFLEQLLPYVPKSAVKEGIERAIRLPDGATGPQAALALGSGDQVTAQDTVPFTLWCAAQQLDDFEEALWLTVSGLGDRDTTCAIVGGIVATHVGMEGLPPIWLNVRERLPGAL